MIAFKKQYYLYIKDTNEIDLKKINLRNKFTIIYRNKNIIEKFDKLLKFRKICKRKAIKFYVANNFKIANKLRSDGVYLSAHNKRIVHSKMRSIIGSAHNLREITQKTNQGCKKIILSSLFKNSYRNKKEHLGLIKFNILNSKKNCVALGGIRMNNLNKLRSLNSDSIAILTEVKKKPATIFSRLF